MTRQRNVWSARRLRQRTAEKQRWLLLQPPTPLLDHCSRRRVDRALSHIRLSGRPPNLILAQSCLTVEQRTTARTRRAKRRCVAVCDAMVSRWIQSVADLLRRYHPRSARYPVAKRERGTARQRPLRKAQGSPWSWTRRRTDEVHASARSALGDSLPKGRAARSRRPARIVGFDHLCLAVQRRTVAIEAWV